MPPVPELRTLWGRAGAAGWRSEQWHQVTRPQPGVTVSLRAWRQLTLINPDHVNYPEQAPCTEHSGDPACRNVPLDQVVAVTTGTPRILQDLKECGEQESEPLQGDVHIWGHRGTAHVSQAVC